MCNPNAISYQLISTKRDTDWVIEIRNHLGKRWHFATDIKSHLYAGGELMAFALAMKTVPYQKRNFFAFYTVNPETAEAINSLFKQWFFRGQIHCPEGMSDAECELYRSFYVSLRGSRRDAYCQADTLVPATVDRPYEKQSRAYAEFLRNHNS